MVNSILNAVTKQLGTTFGNSYHYYVENVEQDLKKPCFTVDLLIPIQEVKSPILYDRTMPLVIHYFSGSKTNIKNNCYEIGEQIVNCLEYLPFGTTLLRGYDISWQIVDEVLQVFITYKFKTKRIVVEDDAMETVEDSVTHSNN